MAKPIMLVSCTRYSSTDFWAKSPLAPYLRTHIDIGNIQKYTVRYENREGLPAVYNQFISEQYKDWIVLFVHDDIELYNIDLRKALMESFRSFDLVGVAGNQFHDPTRHPVRWFMEAPDGMRYTSGQVTHLKTARVANDRAAFTVPVIDSYGPARIPVSVIDGVFMAVNMKACLERNLRFDERFDYHFYDLDFSYNATRSGLRVGTWDILIKHYSQGSYDSKSWAESEQIYRSKWGAIVTRTG